VTTSGRERALITGGGGFVGLWLARSLARRGTAVTLAGLGPAPVSTTVAEGTADWVPLDVCNSVDVRAILADTRPHAVYHLAGLSFPPAAADAAAQTVAVNVGGAVNLLTAIASDRRRGVPDSDPVVLVVGSATQYGVQDSASRPITEDADQRPVNLYGASKAAQEVFARQLFRADGVRVICTRSFNHTGVGHGEQYLLPSLVRRVLELQAGGGRTLAIGNDNVRDFLHVADVVDAYIALVARGTPGEVYNVSSGVGHRVSELARTVLLRVGLSADIVSEPTLARQSDTPTLVGSPAKLMAATGWAPRFTPLDIIDQLIHAATQ
jgi:GDP-4-dehydro-6-deoxy-D-mannose reductase